MAKYNVCGIGAALVDTEIEVSDADLETLQIEKGLMTLVDEERQHQLIDHLKDHLTASRRACGGSTANTLIAVNLFGGRTFYSCKVANDDNGHFYLDNLTSAGVDYQRNGTLNEGITGKCLVLITPDAERTMNTFLGISETVSAENLDFDAIENSEYLYIEGYLVTSPTGRAAAIKARQQAERLQVKTAISLSDPGMVSFFKDGLKEMIGDGVDLLFCNKAEAFGWTGTATVGEAVEQLKNTAKAFAITLGSDGAIIYDGENLHAIAPHCVTAIDTNGAGDMFAGAFLYALTHGYGYDQAGHFASLASATVVSQFGPRLDPQQHVELLQTFDNEL